MWLCADHYDELMAAMSELRTDGYIDLDLPGSQLESMDDL
jgi:hypothetical protein